MAQTLLLESSGFDLSVVPGTDPTAPVTVTTPAGSSGGVFVVNSTTPNPIESLGIDGGSISETVSINASVNDLQTNLSIGDDRLQIGGNVTASSIELGEGRDTATIKGDFTNSGITSGGERDVLRFEGAVSGSYIDSGAADDLVGFLGDVNGSRVVLGTGNDQVRFYGDATNTTLQLGGGRDTVRFYDPNANTSGLVIEGANSDDLLIIGSSQYKYIGDYTWENLANPNDDLRFGPTPG